MGRFTQIRSLDRVGPLCFSHYAETCSLNNGIRWLLTVGEELEGANILIATDSASTITALQRGPLAQPHILPSETWAALKQLAARHVQSVTMQFVYSHVGIARNEAVNSYISEHHGTLTAAQQGQVGIPLAVIAGAVHRSIKNRWLTAIEPHKNGRKRIVQSVQFTDLKRSKQMCRGDETFAVQLRTDASRRMGSLHYHLFGTAECCRWCNQPQLREAIEHIFSHCQHRDVIIAKESYPLLLLLLLQIFVQHAAW